MRGAYLIHKWGTGIRAAVINRKVYSQPPFSFTKFIDAGKTVSGSLQNSAWIKKREFRVQGTSPQPQTSSKRQLNTRPGEWYSIRRSMRGRRKGRACQGWEDEVAQAQLRSGIPIRQNKCGFVILEAYISAYLHLVFRYMRFEE